MAGILAEKNGLLGIQQTVWGKYRRRLWVEQCPLEEHQVDDVDHAVRVEVGKGRLFGGEIGAEKEMFLEWDEVSEGDVSVTIEVAI